jgi:cobalt-zinc-cadmium resistance protein CzcA
MIAHRIERIQEAVGKLPGNAYEFTQPVQMRFKALIAGVRSDLAVKGYGDEFEPMLQTANGIAGVLRGIEGASVERVEQVTGVPFLDIKLNLDAADVIAVSVGGREAGFVFEGDRRFPIVVCLPDAVRADTEALRNLPIPLPHEAKPGEATRAAVSGLDPSAPLQQPGAARPAGGCRR